VHGIVLTFLFALGYNFCLWFS